MQPKTKQEVYLQDKECIKSIFYNKKNMNKISFLCQK